MCACRLAVEGAWGVKLSKAAGGLGAPHCGGLRAAIVPASGLACAQGWLPLVAACGAAYRDGNLAFVMAPLWFGYVVGATLSMAMRLLPFERAGGDEPRRAALPLVRDGAALGSALLGLIVLTVSHSMSEVLGEGMIWPTGAVAFAACLLVGAGSATLSTSWLARTCFASSTDGCAVEWVTWTFAACFACALAAVATLMGHNVWAPLLNAVLVVASFGCLATQADGRCGVSGDGLGRSRALLRPFARPCAAGAVLGIVFAMMIGQFLGAQFGRALSWTWVFGFGGIALAAAAQLSVRFVRRTWSPTVPCWLTAAAMVVAFYPIDAGSDFSLKFAMAGATLALWTAAAVLPPAVTAFARAQDMADVAGCHLAVWLGFALGAAVGGPAGLWVSGTSMKSTFVLVSAMVSMVAGFVVLAWLLRPAQREGKEAALPPEPEPESEASLDDRCSDLAASYGLTPREREVLKVLARGYDVARIQEELGVSEGTALTHKRHIYQKLGVHSRVELLDKVGA